MNEAFPEPILIVAFNRPDRVRELIDRLREVKPSRVFIAVDGPREGNDSDRVRVPETRALVDSIDWPCDVQTLFQETNLGCGRGVSTAISWFFDHVERGIVLEDDVLPRVEFFTFCAELLDLYEHDDRVFAISGCNFVPPDELAEPDASYRFSGITHVWGWAGWRRAWSNYEFDMRRWRQRLPLRKRWAAMGGNMSGFLYWTAVFDWMRFGHIDTWDYQFSLAQMSSGGLTATSNVNLTDNVGFTEDSTHTNYEPHFIRPSEPMAFPIVHPRIERDLEADRWVRAQILQTSTQGKGQMLKANLAQRLASATAGIRGKRDHP